MTRIELKEKVIKLRHLLEERKRLVEYAEQQFFYRKNKKSDLKTDYAKKGFVFGWSEESGKDGLLSNVPSDITQEDFALKMYKVNKSNKYLDEDNLIDALTYFFCGYDLLQNVKKNSETIADKKKYSKKAYYDLVLDDLPKGLEQSEIKKKKQLMKDTISKEKELKSENS